MNASNAKDYLPLVQALADGKVIQSCNGVGDWQDINGRVDFLMPPANYRIKPEPREILMNEYEDGGVNLRCWPSEDAAKANANGDPARQVRYREVIE